LEVSLVRMALCLKDLSLKGDGGLRMCESWSLY